MSEKFGPCLEKGCSFCCNPVKVDCKKHVELSSTKDNQNNEIWKDSGEIWISEEHPDSVKLGTFKCESFDENTGKCSNYENRPDICRNTSCVDEMSEKSVDEQYDSFVNTKFIKIKK